ncbi:hypothetical protein [Pedobacter cryotolerans]|uniref:Lipoprotein n=1 Tax=Pedobacter cryotolerans TaxID=2571270 RepID=A0A4V5P0I8_9SPHI|nr:hypothetical protein [Pedobacter cryotolerans]TKC01493.1 hypothetical protein FA045_09665 [Pedobacter cryotolerans]
MKLNNAFKSLYLGLVAISFLFACTSDEKPVTTAKTEVAPVSKNPFPFYKSIEIKPGFNFEVVSWGKGIDTLGGYLILMSDSLKNNYKSISVEREGVISEAWNMDLDNDGNPEIYIQYLIRKNTNDLNVYEYANNGFNKISFPGLSSENKKGYKGDDQFYIKNGDLFRTVPIVTIDSGKTTTLVKTLQYSLRGNSFAASEVKYKE